MSNEIRDTLKPEIDKVIHKWILQTHYEFNFSQNQMSALLEMDPRSYAALEAKANGCGLETFLLYLFRACPNGPAFLLELHDKINELIPPPSPEMILSPSWLYRERRWMKSPVQSTLTADSFLCPNCKAALEQTLQHFCGNCGQALDWSSVLSPAELTV